MSGLLQEWQAAALNLNRYSLMTRDQAIMYQRTVTQIGVVDNLLDERAFALSQTQTPPPHFGTAFKLYLDDIVKSLNMQVIGMRLFEPSDAFVVLRVDPMRDLMLVLRFVFAEPFTMGNGNSNNNNATTSGSFVAAKTTPLQGAYISNVMFEAAVTLSGHTQLLSLQRVAFGGYFYGVRERILFDQGDAALLAAPQRM